MIYTNRQCYFEFLNFRRMARKSPKLPVKESSSKMGKQCKIEHFFKKPTENHSGDRRDADNVENKKTCSSEFPVNVHKRKRNPSNDSEGNVLFYFCLFTRRGIALPCPLYFLVVFSSMLICVE